MGSFNPQRNIFFVNMELSLLWNNISVDEIKIYILWLHLTANIKKMNSNYSENDS